MKATSPSVLILGSRFDLTCDYVVAQLCKLGYSYLRLNSEDLPALELGLDPVKATLVVRGTDIFHYLDLRELKSVFYRRPVFLRDYDEPAYKPFERFQRQQWAAFLRNLMVFDTCLWVNHPAATYFAEHKAVQLRVAHKVGFAIPGTIVTNQESLIPRELSRGGKVVVKGLDTVLMRQGLTETFGFTQILERSQLLDEEMNSAPAVFQEPIVPKLDIRVTVIGSDVFAASILSGGKPVKGDWREEKARASFHPYVLPVETRNKCLRLLEDLGLVYGAIDLALEGDTYYFLEINPTGEWAWLVDSAGLPIDLATAKCLVQPTPTT